jgi:transposase-like protein
VRQVARDFDLTETAVREWVKQAERDAGTRHDGGLTREERRELTELRRENRRLREDVEILKWATAFFTEETWCTAIRSSRRRRLAGATSNERARCCRSPVPPSMRTWPGRRAMSGRMPS